MIEFKNFIKEVNKKFQDEFWADFESKFFGKNLFIKAGIDFSYSHYFELYIENACVNKLVEEWTVDLRKNHIIYLEGKGIYFITDDDKIISVSGERYFVNLATTVYYSSSTENLKNYIINEALMDLSSVSDILINNHFEELKL